MSDKRIGIFGDLNADIRGQRLLTVGFGLGLICGIGFPVSGWEWFGFITGIFLVALRSWAQVQWPDRAPDDTNPYD